MSATAYRGITVSLLVLSAVWVVAPAAGQPSETSAVRVPRIEIDRAAVVIDVAAQRRQLDTSIRRALDARSGAGRAVQEHRLATSDARPRG
jgi:hypothetical protein